MDLQRVVCELESMTAIVSSCPNQPRRHSCGKAQKPQLIPGVPRERPSLLLKGQMKVSKDFNAVAFLCAPL